jgi:hypothetical protein
MDAVTGGVGFSAAKQLTGIIVVIATNNTNNNDFNGISFEK